MIARRSLLARAAVMVMAGGMAGRAGAQPSKAPLPPSPLDTGLRSRIVHDFRLPATGEGPTYRIGVLVPAGPAPARGWPVLYMLDGQAVLERLTDEVLSRIPPERQGIIVTLGYDTQHRFATRSRARDYTPPDPQGRVLLDPRSKTEAGRAADFWQLLVEQIVPRAESYARVDPQARSLWGHSYGGLFVLFAASHAQSPFGRYISASPALWWNDGQSGPAFAAQMLAGSWPRRPLEFNIGSAEQRKARDPGTAQTRALVAMRRAADPEALSSLVATARGAGIPVSYEEFPDLGHGESFLASLYRVIGLPS